MARPKSVEPMMTKELALPQSLVVRVNELLYSKLEGKIPYGAWQRFAIHAFERELAYVNSLPVPAETPINELDLLIKGV